MPSMLWLFWMVTMFLGILGFMPKLTRPLKRPRLSCRFPTVGGGNLRLFVMVVILSWCLRPSPAQLPLDVTVRSDTLKVHSYYGGYDEAS